MLRKGTILVIAIAVTLSGFTLNTRSQHESNKASPVTIFTVPLGAVGIHYKGGDVKETEVTGPASLRIAPDGTFVIADTITNRVLRYRPDGSMIGAVTVKGALAVTDAVISGSEIFVLDEATSEPTIHRLSASGSVMERITLPETVRLKGVSGLAVSENGEVLAEVRAGAEASSLYGNESKGKSLAGEQFSVESPDLSNESVDPSSGVVIKGQERVAIRVDNILGSLSVIGTSANGDFYVLVEELSNSHILHVDQTVRRYNANGTFLSVARVPIAARYSYVRNGVAVAPDGNVYALITRPDGADVIRLRFSRTLQSILPPANEPIDLITKPNLPMLELPVNSQAPASPVPQATACRSRDDMYNTAMSYVNNWTYLTAVNLNGACSGRAKPRSLGTTPKSYPSVYYDWGGYDTVAQFNSYMSQGYKAGDIATSTIESCSRGVDCSGFLSRVWASGRYTTSTLPNISTPITLSQLQRGDIFNAAGSHVAMFERIVSNGVYTIEATMYNRYDRVVNIYNGWSRFNGYRFYRYNNACGGTSVGQARPVVTSSLTLWSSSPYYIGQTLYADFTITNRGTKPITFSKLLVGGRFNGAQCCVDFSTVNNVTLSQDQSYSYTGWRYLDRAGSHSLYVAYQKTDGSWVTNVDTENGARNALSITVQDNLPPSLSGQSPSYIYSSPYDQTVYFYGERLANTSKIYVQFPNGGAAYIYPPAQIFSRSYSQLGCQIKFGGSGWYYLEAYTAEGGWSNGYWLWVY